MDKSKIITKHEPAGDKFFSSAVDEASIFITLGHGNEFGISGSNLFIRQIGKEYYEDTITIDLGLATKENFRRMVNFMNQLEIHMS